MHLFNELVKYYSIDKTFNLEINLIDSPTTHSIYYLV